MSQRKIEGGAIIGYARVSTEEQNLARQLESLKEFGCQTVFSDKISGKNFADRGQYNKMKKALRFNDTVVIHELSRLGRNKEEIMNEWKELVEKDVDIVVLNMPILDTRQYKGVEGLGNVISEIFLTILSWMVEEERNRMLEAQREGIEIAKRNGVYKGSKKKFKEDNKGVQIAYEMYKAKKHTMAEIVETVNISRSTLYRRFAEIESPKKEEE